MVPGVDAQLQARAKSLAKRSRTGVVAGRIAVERTRDLRRLLGQRDGPMGATHQRFDLAGSVDYVTAVFDDYVRYGGIEAAALEGASVLELGPGDNLGVALRFLAGGAERVVSTDRFIPYRDPAAERRVYEALISELEPSEASRVRSVLERGGVDWSGVPFTFLQETPIEDAPLALGGSRFDLIVSRAVLEHVHDLDGAFAAMDQLLEPGGTIIHEVDLNDHGMFTGGGQSPLTFLTIGDRAYSWMGEESAGLPNRHLIGWYRATMERIGYDARFLVTHTVGSDDEIDPHAPVDDWSPSPRELQLVESIRPKLLPRFRDLAAEELAIAGFMLVAQKPASAGAPAG